jgi:hypothetical protein
VKGNRRDFWVLYNDDILGFSSVLLGIFRARTNRDKFVEAPKRKLARAVVPIQECALLTIVAERRGRILRLAWDAHLGGGAADIDNAAVGLHEMRERRTAIKSISATTY